jgi:hypothetical protein
MKHVLFIFCSVLIICTSVAYSQADIDYECRISEKFKSPVHSVVNIKFPDGTKDMLNSDTSKLVQFVKTGYFNQAGDYLLTVNFSVGDSINETTDYGFTLNNKELEVEIFLSIGYSKKIVKVNEKRVEKQLIPKGYISVSKIYNSPESVSLVLDSIKESKPHSGPFFSLINNSSDTLYGEYLPGYFWGGLHYEDNDSLWQKELIADIDLLFKTEPPLLPGSSSIASVGSFGIRAKGKIKAGNYRYTLYYSLMEPDLGYSLYKDKDNFEWWAKTNEFYKLVYRFKVE